MIHEIDSSNIIAVMLSSKKTLDTVTLSYASIRKIADSLEKINHSYYTTTDLISIDAFRCSFSKYVVMHDKELVIRNFEEIHNKLTRLLPSEEIVESIKRIQRTDNL